jgi:hypothetical protein
MLVVTRDALHGDWNRLEQTWGKDWANTHNDDPEYVKVKTAFFDAKEVKEAAERALEIQTPIMKIEVATNLATEVAQKMGVDMSNIVIFDGEPREFMVGNQKFFEAGHYDRDTQTVVVNVREMNASDADEFKGMMTHELSHLIYHSMKVAAERERTRFYDKLNASHKSFMGWHQEHFETDPDHPNTQRVKVEHQEEIERDYPASLALSVESGGWLFEGISDDMITENGHSDYAKSYWTKEALNTYGNYEHAVNETIAEVTRFLYHPASWDEDHKPDLDSPWVKLTSAMHRWHKQRKAKIQAMRGINR